MDDLEEIILANFFLLQKLWKVDGSYMFPDQGFAVSIRFSSFAPTPGKRCSPSEQSLLKELICLTKELSTNFMPR